MKQDNLFYFLLFAFIMLVIRDSCTPKIEAFTGIQEASIKFIEGELNGKQALIVVSSDVASNPQVSVITDPEKQKQVKMLNTIKQTEKLIQNDVPENLIQNDVPEKLMQDDILPIKQTEEPVMVEDQLLGANADISSDGITVSYDDFMFRLNKAATKTNLNTCPDINSFTKGDLDTLEIKLSDIIPGYDPKKHIVNDQMKKELKQLNDIRKSKGKTCMDTMSEINKVYKTTMSRFEQSCDSDEFTDMNVIKKTTEIQNDFLSELSSRPIDKEEFAIQINEMKKNIMKAVDAKDAECASESVDESLPMKSLEQNKRFMEYKDGKMLFSKNAYKIQMFESDGKTKIASEDGCLTNDKGTATMVECKNGDQRQLMDVTDRGKGQSTICNDGLCLKKSGSDVTFSKLNPRYAKYFKWKQI